jgi:acyl-CoA hydrolase
MYVMRDATNYKQKMKVCSLSLDSIKDKEEKSKALLRQEIGNENKKQRIKRSQLSLFKSPPTYEESAILHEQFVSFKANKDIVLSQYTKGLDTKLCNVKGDSSHSHARTIQETRVEKSLLMHSQNINVNGHVFGGYIMREALEIAFVCAYMHANKENPSVISVDSVTFHRPVLIGSVAQFTAHVALVHEELVHVCVEVFNFVDTQTSPVLTTTINVTYRTTGKTPRVFPTTYECGVKYLEAKRIIENNSLGELRTIERSIQSDLKELKINSGNNVNTVNVENSCRKSLTNYVNKISKIKEDYEKNTKEIKYSVPEKEYNRRLNEILGLKSNYEEMKNSFESLVDLKYKYVKIS